MLLLGLLWKGGTHKCGSKGRTGSKRRCCWWGSRDRRFTASPSLTVSLPHTCCESDIKTLANLAWKCHKNAADSLARIADIVSFKLNLMGRTRPHLLLVVSSFRWQDDLASASASARREEQRRDEKEKAKSALKLTSHSACQEDEPITSLFAMLPLSLATSLLPPCLCLGCLCCCCLCNIYVNSPRPVIKIERRNGLLRLPTLHMTLPLFLFLSLSLLCVCAFGNCSLCTHCVQFALSLSLSFSLSPSPCVFVLYTNDIRHIRRYNRVEENYFVWTNCISDVQFDAGARGQDQK